MLSVICYPCYPWPPKWCVLALIVTSPTNTYPERGPLCLLEVFGLGRKENPSCKTRLSLKNEVVLARPPHTRVLVQDRALRMVSSRWHLLLLVAPAACLLSMHPPALRRTMRLAADDDETCVIRSCFVHFVLLLTFIHGVLDLPTPAPVHHAFFALHRLANCFCWAGNVSSLRHSPPVHPIA